MNQQIRGQFSAEQIEQLLKPIRTNRVVKDAQGHYHVSQQDIHAHLIRMFGFGNFDIEVLDQTCLFETSQDKISKNTGYSYQAWDVAYRCMVRITIRNQFGQTVAFYENGSVGSAQSQPNRADAHDLAYKSAISLSIKRAAIALGDQFGLSLYNKGQFEALVVKTLVGNGVVQHDIQAAIHDQLTTPENENTPAGKEQTAGVQG